MNVYHMQSAVKHLSENLDNLDMRLTKVYDALEALAHDTTLSEAQHNLVLDAITELEGV